MFKKTKRCSKCKTKKSLSLFYKNKSSHDGHVSRCIPCSKIRAKEYAATQSGKKAKTKADKKYRQTPRGKKLSRLSEKRYRETSAGRRSAERKSKKYSKTKKGRANIRKKSAVRRTRKTQAGGSFTANEFTAICKQYDNRCLSCGKSNIQLEADHVIPVAKGGSSDISNIQPLCRSCNASKGTSSTDYRTRPGLLRWIQRRLF